MQSLHPLKTASHMDHFQITLQFPWMSSNLKSRLCALVSIHLLYFLAPNLDFKLLFKTELKRISEVVLIILLFFICLILFQTVTKKSFFEVIIQYVLLKEQFSHAHQNPAENKPFWDRGCGQCDMASLGTWRRVHQGHHTQECSNQDPETQVQVDRSNSSELYIIYLHHRLDVLCGVCHSCLKIKL